MKTMVRFVSIVALSVLTVPAIPVEGVASGQEKVLIDTEGIVTDDESRTRCGKYFVLETKQYGDFEVKQLHVAFDLGSGVAIATLYYSDVEISLDETKTTPVLLQKRDDPELNKDTIKLSETAFEDAKACLPPLDAE